MTSIIDIQAAKYLSKIRLYRYAIINTDNQLQAYFDNLIVSEKLMGMISIFEVIFRNRIHALLEERFGSDYLAGGDPCIFNSNEKGSIKSARKEATKAQVKIKESRILAELTLGFWCGLALNRKLWAKCLHKIHLGCSKNDAVKFKDFAKRIRLISDIRNMVAHHDRITKKRPFNINDILQAITKEVLLLIDDTDRDFKRYIDRYLNNTAKAIKAIVSDLKKTRGQ